jgi:hypothetical protein
MQKLYHTLECGASGCEREVICVGTGPITKDLIRFLDNWRKKGQSFTVTQGGRL